MATTVEIPDTNETCAYCGSHIFDPICVRDCIANCGSPVYFCNYACLSAYINENEPTYGDAYEWSSE